MVIQRKYTLRQVAEHFGVSRYQIEQMVKRGDLQLPLPRQNTSEMRYWSQSQVNYCDQKIYEQSLPPVPAKESTFRFSKKREARIIANALMERTTKYN